MLNKLFDISGYELYHYLYMIYENVCFEIIEECFYLKKNLYSCCCHSLKFHLLLPKKAMETACVPIPLLPLHPKIPLATVVMATV